MKEHSMREKNADINKRIVRIKEIIDKYLREMDEEDQQSNKKGAPPGLNSIGWSYASMAPNH